MPIRSLIGRMGFRKLVFTMARPDIRADPLKLFADASDRPGRSHPRR